MSYHHEAMAVRDVEDTLDYGILALKIWFRVIEDWHTKVSESADRYDAFEHERIKTVEQSLLRCGKRTIGQIAWAKDRGYDLENEQEFQRLFDRLESCASPMDKQFAKSELKSCFRDAVAEHERGETESVNNPWSI